MATSLLSFGRQDPVLLGTKGASSRFALTVVYIADATNNNVVPKETYGWCIPGRTTGVARTTTKEPLMITGGIPKVLYDVQYTSIDEEIAVTLDNISYPEGYWLTKANNIAYVGNYSATTTTVASGTTRTVLEVASGTGANVGEYVEVDLADATYGGCKEARKIFSKSGTTLTINGSFSFIPATGNTVKFLGSTNDYTFYEGGTRPPRKRVKIVQFNSSDASIHIMYFPEVEITAGTSPDAGDGTALVTYGFTFKPLGQFATLTDDNGGSCEKPYTCQEIWIPNVC